MLVIQLDIAQTVGIAGVLLVLGEFVKKHVSLLARYFIPGPIIGGVLFSVLALVGYKTGTFTFEFYDNMRAFLLLGAACCPSGLRLRAAGSACSPLICICAQCLRPGPSHHQQTARFRR